MVVHQNITNLAGYFHFLNVRKIPLVIPLEIVSLEAPLVMPGARAQQRTDEDFLLLIVRLPRYSVAVPA